MNEQKLITVKELCDMWSVDRQWIYRQTHRGCANPLPVIRLGRLLRFRVAELSTWLEAHQQQALAN